MQRALFVALDEWSTARHAAAAEPGAAVWPDGHTRAGERRPGFPTIPGVTYNGLKTTRYLLNYGPDFYATGIATINPPVVTPPYQDNPANGPIYPSFVPKTDSDGNDVAGVRLPDVTVPLATYTGWALRAGAQAGDGCEGGGQNIPFPKTKAERMASGDPRLSIEERYPSFAQVLEAVKKAIEDMVARRLMLREDAQSNVERLLQAGQRDRRDQGRAHGNRIAVGEHFPGAGCGQTVEVEGGQARVPERGRRGSGRSRGTDGSGRCCRRGRDAGRDACARRLRSRPSRRPSAWPPRRPHSTRKPIRSRSRTRAPTSWWTC